MDEKDEEIRVPEIVEEKEKVLTKVSPGERHDIPLSTTISRFSTLSFYNKLRESGLNSWRKVIQQEAGLMEDLSIHARARGRLKDVEIEIETDHLERLNRLREVQREANLGAKKDTIAELELRVKENALKEKLKINTENGSKVSNIKKALKEKLLIGQVYQEYEVEKLKMEIKKELKSRQAIDEVFVEVTHEIFQGRHPAELKEEETKILQDLADLRDSVIDER